MPTTTITLVSLLLAPPAETTATSAPQSAGAAGPSSPQDAATQNPPAPSDSASAPAPTTAPPAPVVDPASAPAPAPPTPPVPPPAVTPAPETATPPANPTPAPAPEPSAADLRKEHRAQRRQKEWPDKPINARLDILATWASTLVSSPSYEPFDDNTNASGFNLGLRADFRLGESPFFVGGALNYQRYNTQGRALRVDNTLTVDEPIFSVRGSWVPLDGIDVFLELGAGPSVHDIELRSDSNTGTQRTITGMGNAWAGGLFYLPKSVMPRKGSARATAGLDAALGYAVRGSVDVDPSLSGADDDIPLQPTALGDLNTSGFIWRVGLFLRFM